MASISGNKKLSIPVFTLKDIKELSSSCIRISPNAALGLSTSNKPVLVWDNEDEDGNPFLPTFGYAMGMSITHETGDLEIYVYSPENGNCLPYKNGVEVPVGFLPEVFAKVGEHFLVGKIIAIDRDIELAQILARDDHTYVVTLSNIVFADNVKLGLEVTRADEAKESNDNEV